MPQDAFLTADPEVLSSSYDEDGNLTSDGRWKYTYDAENRLIAMETNTSAIPNASKQKLVFVYDYMGRRVQKTLYDHDGTNYNSTPVDDFKYIYNGWTLVAMINAKGSGEPIIPDYFRGLDLSDSMQGAGGVGGLLAIQEDGETYLPAYDAMGNLHALMTVTAATINSVSYSAGDVVAAYEYDAFGKTLRESGAYAADNPFRFSTKYTDNETSLVYNGHRYYSPSLGRFINRDPIEEQGGINLYSFVGNNSINAWDYLGMDAFGAYEYWENSTGSGYRFVELDGMSGQDHIDAATMASNLAVTGTGNYNADNSGATPYARGSSGSSGRTTVFVDNGDGTTGVYIVNGNEKNGKATLASGNEAFTLDQGQYADISNEGGSSGFFYEQTSSGSNHWHFGTGYDEHTVVSWFHDVPVVPNNSVGSPTSVGTHGVSINGTITRNGAGLSADLGIVRDNSGNWDVQFSLGYTVAMDGQSANLLYTYTDAESVSDLLGFSSSIGGAGGLLVGGETNSIYGDGYIGADAGLGVTPMSVSPQVTFEYTISVLDKVSGIWDSLTK